MVGFETIFLSGLAEIKTEFQHRCPKLEFTQDASGKRATWVNTELISSELVKFVETIVRFGNIPNIEKSFVCSLG